MTLMMSSGPSSATWPTTAFRRRPVSTVTDILVDKGRVVGVQTRQETYPAAAVILATGGASYPDTGSTGDGYRMAAAVGHTITRLRPALVPLVVFEDRASPEYAGRQPAQCAPDGLPVCG